MGSLIYSIFRYEPSMVSGEKINIGAVFYYDLTGYREFYSISKWTRVSAFDDTLNISLLKDLMEDIREEVGTQIDNPDFSIKKFCCKYHSEFYFDNCVTLTNISEQCLSSQIEEIKNMYFQFEYEVSKRPDNMSQKNFLRRLLVSKSVEYEKNYKDTSIYGDIITYDFKFNGYGVVFFNFNSEKIDNKTMNKVKAWAWNAKNSMEQNKLIILYDLEEKEREDIKPALRILNDVATDLINIHGGFSDISYLIDDVV